MIEPIFPKPEEASVDTILDAGVDLIASLLVGKIDADGRRITDHIGSNAGVIYLGERFAIRDYCWCDWGQGFDEEPPDPKTSVHLTEDGNCPANFEHYASGLRLTWYKHSGRSEKWENLPDTQNAATAGSSAVPNSPGSSSSA